jgi:hypothetical protein
MAQRQGLASIYRRISKNCCDEWRLNKVSFYEWYKEQSQKQNECCHYCHLSGDTINKYGRWFREGRRGHNLEVDKKDNSKPYSPENCVLACYPCNNAKSDVFTYKEFLEIGKAIQRVKANSQ